MGRKIGIFGGSFDPVHLGHVAVVVHLLEAHHLDIVYIVPAKKNPHKVDAPQEAKHRLAMLKKAFATVPKCQILDLELKRKEPSYTIDTVRFLIEKEKIGAHDCLYLLLGEDQLPLLHTWKEADLLQTLCKPLIARRGTSSLVSDTPYFDISATMIRTRLKKKKYCGHLLHKDVYNYIQKQKLYE